MYQGGEEKRPILDAEKTHILLPPWIQKLSAPNFPAMCDLSTLARRDLNFDHHGVRRAQIAEKQVQLLRFGVWKWRDG